MTTTPEPLDWVVIERLHDDHLQADAWQALPHTEQDRYAVALMDDHGWSAHRLRGTFSIGPNRMRRLATLRTEDHAATA